MSSSWMIRNFLIQRPPAKLIRLTSEGETEEIVPGKRSKVKIAETIANKQPELVDCYDEQGKLLRSLRLDEELPARSAKGPDVPIVIQQDPQVAMLTHFANLIHRAYEHATDIAFVKFVDLIERMNERSDSIEQRLERTEADYRREQRERLDDLYDRVEERAEEAANGDPKDKLITAFMSGMGPGPAQAQARSNGKPPSNGGS